MRSKHGQARHNFCSISQHVIKNYWLRVYLLSNIITLNETIHNEETQAWAACAVRPGSFGEKSHWSKVTKKNAGNPQSLIEITSTFAHINHSAYSSKNAKLVYKIFIAKKMNLCKLSNNDEPNFIRSLRSVLVV